MKITKLQGKRKKEFSTEKLTHKNKKKEEKPATAKLSLKRNRDGTFKTGGNRKEELLKERQKLQEKLVSLQETMKETRKQFAEEIQKIKKEISTSTADFGTAKALEEEYSKLKNNPEG
jgi:molecular chaperone GrpE (heat shock protein)